MRYWWLLGILVVAALVGAGWMGVRAHRAKSLSDPDWARKSGRPIPVRTEKVVRRTFEDVIGATAITEPSESASIWVGPGLGLKETRVIVRKVHIAEGQHVERGEPLFELDDELFVQAVKRQETALAAARAELEAVHLLRKQRAATGIQLRVAEHKVELAELDLQIARRDLETCQVTSPIDGFVDAVTTVLGERVDSEREFTKIHKLNPIHVRADFPQERIDDAFIGQQAEIVLDSFPNETFEAQVIRISPQVNPELRVLPVVLEMKNPGNRAKAGISGFARLRCFKTATAAPAAAVIQRGRKAMVFRVEGGKARIQPVRAGTLVENGWVEVSEGLAPGDDVVVYGKEALRHNDPVDVNWRQWARRE